LKKAERRRTKNSGIFTSSMSPFARRAILLEARATIAVAGPLAAANLAQMTMGFINTVMVGSLGGTALAAAGLGAALYFTISVVCQGILTAVAPLAAHAIGAGDRETAGRIAYEGFFVAAIFSMPVIAALTFIDRLLILVGYDPALAAEVGRFLGAIVWGSPAFLGFAVLRSFLVAASRSRAVMAALGICIPMNAVLNWVLMFGHLGAPALGIAGSGRATAIVQWLMFAGLAIYAHAVPGLAPFWAGSRRLSRHRGEFGRILRLGLPIGGLLALEVGVFATTGVLMGVLGVDALGAHQLVMNAVSVIFMVPLGIAQAATVRVALALGSGAPAAARRASFVALGLGASFMALMALLLWSAPRLITRMYVDTELPANRALVAIALRLLVIAALFQIFDGMQAIASGALRGYRDTTVPLLLAAIGYWGLGFAGGWMLAFPAGYGPVGLWWGLAVGLAAVAVMLTARLYFRAGTAVAATDRGPGGLPVRG
jgi:multidrug resistance protein, MATE family